jgi:hypothetical protein
MSRNPKALGLALVAAFALCALGASSASAADVFISKEKVESVTAEGSNNEFKITGIGSVKCARAKFNGNVTAGSTEATFTATYEGTPAEPSTEHCEAFAGKATVSMNGCAYILTGETTGGDEGTDATAWIECPAGKEIAIIASSLGLTVHIHAQTPTAGGVTYTNTPAGKVTIHETATGITYSCEPDFLCTLGGIAIEGNNADYTGTVVAEGAHGGIEVTNLTTLRCDDVGELNGEFKSESDCTATAGKGSGKAYVWRRYPL